jgi:hypothetical protein
MASGATARINLDIPWTAKKDVDGVNYSGGKTFNNLIALVEGTSDGQLSKIVQKLAESVDATSANTYDLAGSLTDQFGATITFTKIKLIAVVNKSTTELLYIGGNAAEIPLFGNVNDKLKIPAGGMALPLAVSLNASGIAVTGTTGDILTIENPGAGAATYDILIAGV